MSIKCMSKVWDESKQKGSNLLVLLALADFADDFGYCWPSIATIAAKARLSERQTIRIIQSLEEQGELLVKHDRRNGNKYIVRIRSLQSDKMTYDTDDTSELPQLGQFSTDTAMADDPSMIHQRSVITAHSPNVREPAEELEYVNLEDFEEISRPKWQIPETPTEVEFLSVCNTKWYKPGQKKKVKAIMAAIRAGDILGDDVYSRCYDELQDIPDLTNRNLPPIPQSWLGWRAAHAVSNRWSVDGFIRALLDRDALVKHCRYKMKELGKTPGKIVNGMYIIEIPEGGPR